VVGHRGLQVIEVDLVAVGVEMGNRHVVVCSWWMLWLLVLVRGSVPQERPSRSICGAGNGRCSAVLDVPSRL